MQPGEDWACLKGLQLDKPRIQRSLNSAAADELRSVDHLRRRRRRVVNRATCWYLVGSQICFSPQLPESCPVTPGPAPESIHNRRRTCMNSPNEMMSAPKWTNGGLSLDVTNAEISESNWVPTISCTSRLQVEEGHRGIKRLGRMHTKRFSRDLEAETCWNLAKSPSEFAPYRTAGWEARNFHKCRVQGPSLLYARSRGHSRLPCWIYS
jgi:hypothetical protein